MPAWKAYFQPAKIEKAVAMKRISNNKRKVAETVVGAAVGAVIAGPAGAIAGGLAASQAASHALDREGAKRTSKVEDQEAADPLVHASLKRILVPLDFSKPSLGALRFAREWAVRFGAEICLLHVVEPPNRFVAFESDPFTPPIPAKTLHKQVRAELEKVAHLELPNSLKFSVLLRDGVTYDQIAAVARELKVDLIIVATRGTTGLSRALMGSTAERVVRHAPCPVLTLRCTQ